MYIVPKTLANVLKFLEKLHTNDMYMVPKTLENALKFMGEMTCTWFPKTLAFSLKNILN